MRDPAIAFLVAPGKAQWEDQGFGSPLPRMDSQNKPAMSPTASVALVARSCTSTTQAKDTQGPTAGRRSASCTPSCLGHAGECPGQGATSAGGASHPCSRTEMRPQGSGRPPLAQPPVAKHTTGRLR